MRRLHLSAVTLIVPVLLLGCPSEAPAVCDNGACDTGDASTDGPNNGDGGTDGVAPPAGCDPAADPKDAPKCVVSDYGIFVDATTGSDTNTGSKELPVKTITNALTKLNGRPRIYVCDGTYPESVKLTSPVSIFGGFACTTWAYSGGKAKVGGPTGTPLTLDGVGKLVVADVEVKALADTAKAGDSSVAVLIANSSDVVLRRVDATAGPGTGGAPGASRTNYSGSVATKGGDASGATAGIGASCTCTDATKSAGGNGAAGNGADMTDGSAEPVVGAANSGASKTTSCDPGLVGANGLAGAAASAVTSAGSLTAAGWSSALPLAAAPNGRPAQGGGGAGAKTNTTSAGGGGGCGGCGGAGGGAGGNGGSSFALLAFMSGVTVDGGTFTAGVGGIGGVGGAGQAGQAGGAGGFGVACDGGPGGVGAGGSGGAGGAGGHSAAIAFVGNGPKVNGATLANGGKGAGGGGGTAGGGGGASGAVGPAGSDGKAENTLSL